MDGKQVYALSSGDYEDYRIDHFLRAEPGLDFQALFDEFIDHFYSITPPFAEPEPEPYNSMGHHRKDYEAEYQEWAWRKYDYERDVIKDWNARGYEGSDKQGIFGWWLIKDRGFEIIEYTEVRTDYDIREKEREIEE